MVLYFREREAHDRTKQELAELRAAQQKAQEQRAEEHRLFLEQQAEDKWNKCACCKKKYGCCAPNPTTITALSATTPPLQTRTEAYRSCMTCSSRAALLSTPRKG